jgi:polar amino acid transport system ATP-binding protein
MNQSEKNLGGLNIEDIHAGYGPLEVLKGFSLEVKAGETLALIGPNGAGKSTLLEVLVGGINPSQGKVNRGVESENSPPMLRIAQVPDLPPFLSLLELVTLGLRGWRNDIKDQELYAKELLSKWGLSSRYNRPTRLASPGEIRRALFALVEGIRPKTLLLDEALSALDPAILLQAESLIRELSQEGAITLLVTHDMGLAERIPERVALLHNGILSAAWTSTEIQEARSQGKTLLDLYLETTGA